MLKAAKLDAIADAARERYGKRLSEHGCSVKALGWDTRVNQRERFKHAASLLAGGSVLDVGCGFGDFYAYLRERGGRVPSYTGVDLMEGFVAEARRRHAGSGARFQCGDVLRGQIKRRADTVLALGLLNYRLGSVEENYAYIRRFLRAVWPLARRRVVFDGISVHRAPGYPEEPFIFYAEPGRVLDLAAEFTRSFRMLHDLPPMPQREYQVALDKERR